ncbi:flagellar motor switch protein FliN [bacterium]|nr:flagellar motor switch protein FliN [bacterium]
MSKKFDDPLEGLDPIMEEVFSGGSSMSRSDRGKSQEDQSAKVSEVAFPTLNPDSSGRKLEFDMFRKIPVSVSVELGRAQVSLKEIFELSEGSIIELDRLVGEPLDLVVNGQVVAQGEVVAIDNNYGLRVTHVIAQPSM